MDRRVRVAALCLECGLPNVFEGRETPVRAVCADGTECEHCGVVSPFRIISGYDLDGPEERKWPSYKPPKKTSRDYRKRHPLVLHVLPECTYGVLRDGGRVAPMPGLSDLDGDT